MDGITATCLIREQELMHGNPHTPIIAVTAFDSEDNRTQCFNAGMDDFIAKPFTQDRLLTTLDQWVQEKARSARSADPSLTVKPVDPMDDAILEPFDKSVLTKLRTLEQKGAKGLVKRMVSSYLDTCPDLAASLRQAIEARDADAVYRTAHSLKSSSANVGALKLADMCQQLEDMGRTGSLENIENELVKLDTEFEKVTAAFVKMT